MVRLSRRRTRLVRSGIAAMAAMLLAAQISPVAANERFGSDWGYGCNEQATSQCRGRDRFHEVYFFSLGSEQVAATEYAIDSVYAPVPNAYVVRRYELNDYTDVIVQDGDYGDNGYFGYGYCMPGADKGGVAADHNRWCMPQALQYNTWYKNHDSRWNGNYVACHEMGHTLGLRHHDYDNSCMDKVTSGKTYFSTVLMQHDKDHLYVFE